VVLKLETKWVPLRLEAGFEVGDDGILENSISWTLKNT